MVTLKDIAERLNVSIPLVSKVLNNSRSTVGVSEQTAERIRKAAGEMGYVRNRSAVALRKGRHDSIGVLIQLVGGPGTNLTEKILAQVSNVALHSGQQLQLGFYECEESFLLGLSRMTKAAVDGIIVSGPSLASLKGHLTDVKSSGLPVITLGIDHVGDDIPNIGCNQPELAALSVRHLVERGCSRIAHLNLLPSRYKGYVSELAAQNIAFRKELVADIKVAHVNSDHVSMETGMDAVRQLLDRGVEFDGLTTQCDAHAMAALKVLTEAGLRVPQDVKIVSIDNSPVCQLGSVSITSVDCMYSERAMAATQMMLRVHYGEKPYSKNFEPILYQRQSTAL